MSKKVIVICGATASGKTSLAIELAKKLQTEIICADSLTIYKGLDIGTAKPTTQEKEQAKHHMIDVANIFDTFSVGDYKEMAEPILTELLSKNKTPIICGGTGFYINSLLFNYSYGKAKANLEAREKYYKLSNEFGNDYVYHILENVDKESAEKIHPNDIKRVVRALEIFESGEKKSNIKDDLTPKYDYVAYSYDYPREILYERINERVDKMIENGLVEEVKNLVKNGLTDQNQCLQGIGYKEIYSYLMGQSSLEQAVELIKLNSRHYAKRQITFFKKLDNLVYLDPKENLDITVKGIIDSL